MGHHEDRREERDALLRSRLESIAAEQKPKSRFGFSRSKSERVVSALQRPDAPDVSDILGSRIEQLLDEPKSNRFFKMPTTKRNEASAASQSSHSEFWTAGNRAAVFCHRGFYDQARGIIENSHSAIDNGIKQGLLLHELDARVGPGHGRNKTFLAHDEHAIRTTSVDQMWCDISMDQIWETSLVARSFNFIKNNYGPEFEKTGENVPNIEILLDKYSDRLTGPGCTLQIDLRGDDLPKAIAWFRYKKTNEAKLLLKGYNINFPNAPSLKQAVRKIAAEGYGASFDWKDLANFKVPIIMVFYSWPILKLALEEAGLSHEDRFKLTYGQLLDAAEKHIFSFVEIGGYEGYPLLIPEIVHSGLGLGYDIRTGVARNPLDWSAITNPSVTVDSRLDRAMIEVGLKLKAKYPELISSGCTRLCEVRTLDGVEMIAFMNDGQLRAKPDPKTDAGIAPRCRELHGGLYPKSDIVVADDPFAEIAARTWIDEYAKLDRSKLLEMSYDEWLRTAGKTVYNAVWELQGPFLANTVSLTMGTDLRIQLPRS